MTATRPAQGGPPREATRELQMTCAAARAAGISLPDALRSAVGTKEPLPGRTGVSAGEARSHQHHRVVCSASLDGVANEVANPTVRVAVAATEAAACAHDSAREGGGMMLCVISREMGDEGKRPMG